MNNNSTPKLLSLLIEKTKSGRIEWKPFIYTNMKPVKSWRESFSSLIDMERSYCANFQNGTFFLVSCANVLSLVAQTQSSQYAMECVSTSDSAPSDIAELKRLYNIVDSTDYDVSTFLDNFLNS